MSEDIKGKKDNCGTDSEQRLVMFRAWVECRQEMHHVTELDWNTESRQYIPAAGGVYDSVYPFPLMRYTGKDDIDGVPIYEGDIVEDEHEEKHTIIWNRHHACFCLSDAAYIGLGSDEYFKVIGNIYEGMKSDS